MRRRGHFSSEKMVYASMVMLIGIILLMGYFYIETPDTRQPGEYSIMTSQIKGSEKTILKSADGLASIIVPETSKTSAEEIFIQKLKKNILDKRRAGAAYKFGPTGAVFNNPIELRIRYNSSIAGCPERLNFYHYNDDGTIKENVPSSAIYCDMDTAIFEIDSFSWGYAGLAQRDEEK